MIKTSNPTKNNKKTKSNQIERQIFLPEVLNGKVVVGVNKKLTEIHQIDKVGVNNLEVSLYGVLVNFPYLFKPYDGNNSSFQTEPTYKANIHLFKPDGFKPFDEGLRMQIDGKSSDYTYSNLYSVALIMNYFKKNNNVDMIKKNIFKDGDDYEKYKKYTNYANTYFMIAKSTVEEEGKRKYHRVFDINNRNLTTLNADQMAGERGVLGGDIVNVRLQFYGGEYNGMPYVRITLLYLKVIKETGLAYSQNCSDDQASQYLTPPYEINEESAQIPAMANPSAGQSLDDLADDIFGGDTEEESGLEYKDEDSEIPF